MAAADSTSTKLSAPGSGQRVRFTPALADRELVGTVQDCWLANDWPKARWILTVEADGSSYTVPAAETESL